MNGSFTDDTSRKPTAIAQDYSPKKDSSCRQANTREARVAFGRSAAWWRAQRHIPGERRSFNYTKSVRQVIMEALDPVKADWTDRRPNWTAAGRDPCNFTSEPLQTCSSTCKTS